MLRAMRHLKMRRKLTLLCGLFSAGYAGFRRASCTRAFGAGVSRAGRFNQPDASFGALILLIVISFAYYLAWSIAHPLEQIRREARRYQYRRLWTDPLVGSPRSLRRDRRCRALV